MYCNVIEVCNRGYSSGPADLYNPQNNEILNHSDGECSIESLSVHQTADAMLRPVRYVLYLFSVSYVMN